MAKKKAAKPMIEVRKKGKKALGPQWFKSYDIKWLKIEKDVHPHGKLVDQYERKYGEII